MTVATTSSTELIDIEFSDWEGARSAQLQRVPRSSTIGQVVTEAVEHLGLPFEHLYQAVFRGKELDQTETLEDLGIDTDSQIDLVPEVSAG
jgi:hypothetical protein